MKETLLVIAELYGQTENVRKGMEKVGVSCSEIDKKLAEAYSRLDIATTYAFQKHLADSIVNDPQPIEIDYRHSTRKGEYCVFCATATHKQQKKLDSCPKCGKSYIKYGR